MRKIMSVFALSLLMLIAMSGMVSASDCKVCDNSTLNKVVSQGEVNAVSNVAGILSAGVAGSLTMYSCHRHVTTIPYCCASKNGRCTRTCYRTSTIYHCH